MYWLFFVIIIATIFSSFDTKLLEPFADSETTENPGPSTALSDAPSTVRTYVPTTGPLPTMGPSSAPSDASATDPSNSPTTVPDTAPSSASSSASTPGPSSVKTSDPSSASTPGPSSALSSASTPGPSSVKTSAPSSASTPGPSSVKTSAPSSASTPGPSPGPTPTPSSAPSSVKTSAPSTNENTAPSSGPSAKAKIQSKVAIVCLMRKPIDLPLWLEHHRKLGISKFYIRLEDSPGWKDYLESQYDVSFTLAESDKSGNNYETLQTRQKEYVNTCITRAIKDKIDWIFHIDADEFLKCAEGAPCTSYANGKGAGRVQEGLKLAGPHLFMFNEETEGKHVYEVPFDSLHVLHYDSCTFGGWGEKFLNLSKNNKSTIPFAYYTESMQVAKEAYDVYKKFKMINTEGLDKSMMFYLE